MKGIVFNLLEESVRRDFGQSVWEDLLDGAASDGAFTSLGNYDDAQLFALVGAASKKLGMPFQDVVRWFGKSAIPLFHERYPEFFDKHQNTCSFLLTLNDIIHPEVRKIYPDADVPYFDCETSNDVLRMAYHSKRKLCALAEGMIQGSALHFGETVTIDRPECMHRGDARCVLELRFARRPQ